MTPAAHRQPARASAWTTLLALLACATPALAQAGPVLAGEAKISSITGGLAGPLDDGDRFGRALANLGDLDGDGFDDLAVGAPLDDDGGSGLGAVWILFLGADGSVASEAKISATSGGFTGTLDEFDYFGWSLAALGDLDGDGLTELAVGAILDDDGGTGPEANLGAVWVLFLNSDGTVKAFTKISATAGGFTGTLETHDWFGSAAAGPGDVDGDGVADLAVGALFDDGGSADLAANEGAVWLLFLNADGTARSQVKIGAGSGGFTGILDVADGFGSALAPLGDLDGNGVPDLAVGAMFDDFIDLTTQPVTKLGDAGAVWMLFLAADGTVNTHAKIGHATGGLSGALNKVDQFGAALANVGDLNGDGVVDLAVGAPRDHELKNSSDRGAVWVLHLNTSGLVVGEHKINQAGGGFGATLDNGDWFGTALASLLDRTDNGTGELVAGTPQDDDGGSARGALWVLHRRSLNWLDLGAALAGTLPDPPLLAVDGLTELGKPVSIVLTGALPDASALLVLGMAQVNTPFKGGVLVPRPDFISAPLPTDPLGSITIALPWPLEAGVGFDLFLQYWFADTGAPQGFAASNAVSTHVR